MTMADDKKAQPSDQEQAAVCCSSCFGPSSAASAAIARSLDIHPDDVKSEGSGRRSTQIYHDSHEMEDQIRVEHGDVDLVFFDAVMSELGEDEYPYPIITTSYVPSKPRKVSFNEPATMLRSATEWHSARFEDARADPTEGGDHDGEGKLKDGVELKLPPAPPPEQDMTSSPARSSGSPARGSTRRMSSLKIFRRGSVVTRQDLETPKIKVQERGYPGQLTEEELLQCQMFYREIHQRKGNYLEIVYALRGVEEEAYAICRFMRATKFDASKILERIENNQSQWEEAKASAFYRDISSALGAPLVLFLQHYPYFYHGNAKNGCPVNYFKAGSLQTEALLALVSVDNNARYFWHTFYYTFKEKMIKAKELNPDFVRCESINVMDLKGMSSSQLTGEAMDCMKGVSKIADFFPETLHCMVILNAPTWFAMAWKVIKGFIDPRTARKIEVYANADKGKKRLAELVDASEIPSDFGGTSPSLEESIREHYREAGDQRDFDSILVTVKRHGTEKIELRTLAANETAIVRVYTRSITGATVSVFCQGKLAGKATVKRDNPMQYASTLSDEKKAEPYRTDISSVVQGPGKVTVEVKDLADADPPRKLPQRNFLVAVEVGKK